MKLDIIGFVCCCIIPGAPAVIHLTTRTPEPLTERAIEPLYVIAPKKAELPAVCAVQLDALESEKPLDVVIDNPLFAVPWISELAGLMVARLLDEPVVEPTVTDTPLPAPMAALPDRLRIPPPLYEIALAPVPLVALHRELVNRNCCVDNATTHGCPLEPVFTISTPVNENDVVKLLLPASLIDSVGVPTLLDVKMTLGTFNEYSLPTVGFDAKGEASVNVVDVLVATTRVALPIVINVPIKSLAVQACAESVSIVGLPSVTAVRPPSGPPVAGVAFFSASPVMVMLAITSRLSREIESVYVPGAMLIVCAFRMLFGNLVNTPESVAQGAAGSVQGAESEPPSTLT